MPPDRRRVPAHPRPPPRGSVLALLAALLAVLLPGLAGATDPVVLGRLEMIAVSPGGQTLKARIDTGAGLSSVDARRLQVLPATGDQPERVTFRLRGQKRGTPDLTAPVIDWVEIKGKGTRRTIRRPVISMQLCIGDRWLPARVNLADRSDFLYPLLIGRNTLIAGGLIVDPAALYLEPPRCAPRPAPAPG